MKKFKDLPQEEKENTIMGFAEITAIALEGRDLRDTSFDDIVTIIIEAFDSDC